MVRRCLMVGRLRINGARTGEIFFARTNAVNGYIGYAPRFMVWRCLMVGRLRTNRARRGEIYFARTSVVRRRVAGARSKRVGNCASIADGRKIFRPYKYSVLLNLACATIWGMSMFDGWVMVDCWRTDGRKIFRPYKCGEWLHRVCATIYGVVMFDGWAIAHQSRT